jgi:PAS domain S-box-containing protein
MVQRSSFLMKRPVRAAACRYGIAFLWVLAAFLAIFVLRRFEVRDPFASVFLTAIAVSFLYGGTGPGILSIALSTLSLQFFLHTPGGWLHVALRDLPVFCVFLVVGVAIYRFNRRLRRTEYLLEETLNDLEARVAARTVEVTETNGKLTQIIVEHKALLDAAPFGIALLEPGQERIVRSCNRAYEEMLGFEPGEIIGQPAPLPENERETWNLQERGLRAGQRIENYETRRIRRDGSEFYATIFARPLLGEEGTYNGLLGVIIDDTKRYEQNAEMLMLREMIQNSPDFIGVAKVTGEAVFINKAGQRQFGLEGDEQVRQTNVYQYFAEEQRTLATEHLIPTLVKQGQLEFETVARNFRTGKHFPLHCTCFVIPDPRTKEPAFIAAVAKDLSDRKREEDELRRSGAYLAEGQRLSRIGSWAWNTVTGETFWSQELFRILGLDPEAVKPSLAAYMERVHPDDRAQVERVAGVAVGERRDVDHEYRIVLPGGTIKQIRSMGHPSLSASGVLELIVAAMDVTEQHQREADLQRSLQQIEALLKEKDALEDQLRRENVSLHEFTRALQVRFASIQREGFDRIIGSSPALERLLMMVAKVSRTDSTVLITGETGTGKELVAQAIHENSKRAGIPLVTVNCATLTDTLAASELFGHEKGAFTGAHERHLGHFEAAKGGTILLDEVGELALETQAALLRVLDNQAFQRVGSTTPIRMDVRVLAATNRDLEAAVKTGTFREDLYYRLRSFPIKVPALRERREDIPLLAEHYIAVFAAKYEKTIQSVEKRSLEMLLSYDWPGNVRELQKVIEASVILCEGGTLSIDERQLSRSVAHKQRSIEPSLQRPLQEDVLNYQRARIEDALIKCNGQVGGSSGAAALLGIPVTTLRHRMEALKIEPNDFRGGQRLDK